jgi:hypothetical protein
MLLNHNLQNLRISTMNKSIIASALISALLSGCGSSGGSSSEETVTPVTYTWQVVQLASVDETEAIAGGCIIYDDSDLNEGEVIIAYIAETNYNLLYHNEDGTIDTTISSGDSDFTNGKITISADDVPDNGYVSLEEISSARGGDSGSYMFSVQKSLLSDMVLNVSVSETNADCYTGSNGLGTDYSEEASDTALVNVKDISEDIQYYQSSYDENSINGKTTASYIPVDSPYPGDKDILITTFDTYNESSEQVTDLSYWKFIDSANLFEDDDDASSLVTSNIIDTDLNTLYWSTSDSITLDEDNISGIIALHESNSYFWQPIYNDSDELTVAYGNSEVSSWSAYYSGEEDTFNWLFTSFIPLTDSDIIFALPSSLSTVDSTISVTSSCSVSDSFCIDTNSSFSSDDFDYQRTHIRLEEDDEDNTDAQNIVYQSIYSKSTEQPVVLENSQFTFIDPTLTRIEINVMTSDADSDDATQYLMAQNMNLVSVGEYDSSDGADDDAETDYYSDINGFISTEDEDDALYQALIETTTTILKNAN